MHPLKPSSSSTGRLSSPGRKGLAVICGLLLMSAAALGQITLSPLGTFGGGDGWLAPGEGGYAYLGTANNERGMAYGNEHLYLVSRSGGTNNVRILDPFTGADLGGLNTNGISGGTFAVNMIAVANDGRIYVGNLSTAVGPAAPYKIYQWTDESSSPVAAYSATNFFTGGRVGDSLAVMGSGGSTLLAAGFSGSPSVAGSNSFAIIDPGSSNATQIVFSGTPPNGGDFKLGITFVDRAGVIGLQGGAAGAHYNYAAFSGTNGTLLATPTLTTLAEHVVAYAMVAGKPLLATLTTSNSTVRIYDVTDPTHPVLAATANNTSGALAVNSNGTGSLAWGTTVYTADGSSSTTLYALNSNQGLQAFLVHVASASGPGTAVSFDGLTNSVFIGGNPVPSPWTAEFWVNRQTASDNSVILLGDTNSALKLEQFNNTHQAGFTAFNTNDYLFNYTAPTGTWVHLAFVCDSVTRLYVNGVVQDTNPATINLPMRQIGADIPGRYNNRLHGSLDEVRLWNVARTPDQLRPNMTLSLAGPQTNLLAHWRFDEGAGTNVFDTSGNGLTGALPNSSNWVSSGVRFIPLVTTLLATNLSLTNATLNARVNPKNSPTYAWFQWVSEAGFGSTAPIFVGNTNVFVQVSNVISTVGATNFQVVAIATNAAGMAIGSFTFFDVDPIAGTSGGVVGLAFSGSFSSSSVASIYALFGPDAVANQVGWRGNVALISPMDSQGHPVYFPQGPNAIGTVTTSGAATLSFRSIPNWTLPSVVTVNGVANIVTIPPGTTVSISGNYSPAQPSFSATHATGLVLGGKVPTAPFTSWQLLTRPYMKTGAQWTPGATVTTGGSGTATAVSPPLPTTPGGTFYRALWTGR